jgi:hypothetical protein
MISVLSILIKGLVVFVILWIVLAFFYSSRNATRAQLAAAAFNNDFLNEQLYYDVPEPYTIPLERTKFSTQCALGNRIVVRQAITFVPPETILLLDFLLPRSVERLEIYSSDNTLLYSSWIDFNSMPAVSAAAYQRMIYDFNFDDSHRSKFGFHVIFPANSGVTSEIIDSIADCLIRENLAEVYIANLIDPNIIKDDGYYIDTDGNFATKHADPLRIKHGVYSLTLLSS